MKEKYNIRCFGIWEYAIEVEDGIVVWSSNRPDSRDHWSVGGTFEDLKEYYAGAVDPKYPVYIEKMES